MYLLIYDVLNNITERLMCITQTVVNFCLEKRQHKKSWEKEENLNIKTKKII